MPGNDDSSSQKASTSPATGSLGLLMANSRIPKPRKTSSESSTARWIEQTTVKGMQRVSNREFDNIEFYQNMAPDYTAHVEYQDQPVSTSREQFLSNSKAFAQANPHYEFEVMSINVDVDEQAGTAIVWIHLRVKGHPVNVRQLHAKAFNMIHTTC